MNAPYQWAMGGSKRKNSLGAPKWAIHVKTLLNDLFKLIKGTFHLPGLSLSDLKGDCGSIFGASSMAGIWVFLSID